MLCKFCGIETAAPTGHSNQRGCRRALELALRKLRRTLLQERQERHVRRQRHRYAVLREETTAALRVQA
jgi:hypothetical protein